MTATTIRVQMAQRKDTAANWTAANPILLSGEIGYETDTKKFKIGNGSTNWNSLAYLPIPDGSGNLTITGNLEIGSTGSLTFEGSTADGFETTLAVTNPTADRTITLPDVTGTVVTTGDTGSVTSTMIANGTIVDADVSSTAEIAVSKLANGTANQVIVTDGTNVSWSDNLTLAGDLTVNGTTTTINTQDLLVEDKNIIIGNVATPSDLTADGGGITLKGATDKTINWVDATDAWTLSEHVNIASAKEYRIDGTKVLDATSLGSAVVSSSLTSVGTITSGTWQGTAINATYLDSTVVKTSDTGTVTSAMLADGTIVDGDISATAEIAVSKLADGDARQLLQTDAAGTGVEWASNIDIPGTLDVTGAATFDSTVSVTGALTKSGSDVVTVGDTGTVTSTMILDGTIVDGDVNASAAIAGTKISPNFGSQNVVTTGTSTAASFIPTSSTAPTNGLYLSGTNTVGIATNSTGRLFVDASGRVSVNGAATNCVFEVVGTSTTPTYKPVVQIDAEGNSNPFMAMHRYTGVANQWRSIRQRVPDSGGDYIVEFSDAAAAIGSHTFTERIRISRNGTVEIKAATGSNAFFFTIGGTERLRFDSSGRLGVGTSSPDALLTVGGVGAFGAGAVTTPSIAATGDLNTGFWFPAADTIAASTGGSERARIDSSGRLLVGTSSARANFFNSPVSTSFQVEGTTDQGRGISVTSSTNDASGSYIVLAKQRSGTVGGNTLASNNDQMGAICFQGSDGTEFVWGAGIEAFVDGTPGANVMPSRLVFSTCATGSGSLTERMRINNAGTTTFTSAASTAPFIATIGASEVARIDGSGRLLVGTSASLSVAGAAAPLQVEGTDYGMSITRQGGTTASSGAILSFARSRGTANGSVTAVSNNDTLGYLLFCGANGTALNSVAVRITGEVDGAVTGGGAADMPGRLVIATSADGTASPTERFRITNDGVQAYNQVAPAAVDATATLTVANLKTGIITSTSAAATDMTLPTGTNTEAGFNGIYTNMTFEWSVINTGPSLVTVLAGTAHTIVGSGSVATGTSGRFASRRTAVNTFVTYRLS